MPPIVAIVMGSTSDEPLVQETQKVLDDLGIDYETRVLSAHRTPEKTREYAVTAQDRGIRVLIGVAGAAAHLPECLRVGRRCRSSACRLRGAILVGSMRCTASFRCRLGVPVAAVAVGRMGARNAAYLAASILATADETVRHAYEDFRRRQSEA